MSPLRPSSLFLTFLLVATVLPAANKTFYTSGPTHAKRIALTFDDGPGPETGRVADLLQKYQVKGTFFVLGELAGYRPAVIKRLVAEGHEVADHTYKHLNYKQRYKAILGGLTPPDEARAAALAKKELIEDMTRSRQNIESAGGTKVKLCRMPHGIDRPWISEAAERLGYTLVNWTYGADWSKQPLDELTRDYTRAIKPGAILLFHDGGVRRDRTLALTEAVIKSAQEQNYEIVTVGELLGIK